MPGTSIPCALSSKKSLEQAKFLLAKKLPCTGIPKLPVRADFLTFLDRSYPGANSLILITLRIAKCLEYESSGFFHLHTPYGSKANKRLRPPLSSVDLAGLRLSLYIRYPIYWTKEAIAMQPTGKLVVQKNQDVEQSPSERQDNAYTCKQGTSYRQGQPGRRKESLRIKLAELRTVRRRLSIQFRSHCEVPLSGWN